ncbi:D-alanyl-D-alanine carboxypeptidase [Pedobacter cryoconitis]|uniref:D-alanyl-D-alanine carboxypeptidase/D-alanyl-D-alanine-endopeptidase (Penicillin-binding protein 4) n=1 Tax=Pedobacter cryoconitis TaxID=188932 RepID=A0A327SZ71_9SPHI|nr:D-alanyl-D-alanine carboxypeptidase [Pedobacter cryoconitis]RAJ34301.1 D-alanyl-D-alanine carboxypeptidase/D-alanyl-D-alanine-endopeptidase (penicillin-binding protein 4) [Pedobacter cryoconitis]
MGLKKEYQIQSFFIPALLILLFLESCTVQQRLAKDVSYFLRDSPVLNDHLVGFALSGLDQQGMIYEKNADKYFIPASNTKLYTFYAGLKMIPDSIPSIRYITRGDSLIFWGTGDPSFLKRGMQGAHTFKFLSTSTKQLFFAPGRYTGNAYGQGWAWDDYNDDTQAEITELPMLDNLAAFSNENGRMTVDLHHFNDCLVKDSLNHQKEFIVVRKLATNEFNYPSGVIPTGFTQLIPYKTSTLTTLNLLRDTLGRDVQLIQLEMPATAKTIYNSRSEDIFREMLLPSDNFIAEQLLLVYANQFQQKLSSTDAIRYILNKYLKDLPDRPRWVDGSGVSRMNLFSPRDMIMLLQLINKEVNNREKLFSMLPAGGLRGTLKNAYPKTDHPFVFAKTGTFSNNYNQSGYIVTKKGKILVFSFMNNNFMGPIKELKAEMAKLMGHIHDQY